MTQRQIQMYGAPWCPDCKQAKQFLSEQRIPYEWHDIDRDKEAQAYVRQVNNGKQIIPTIVFPDGSVLVEPSNSELADKLNIRRQAQRSFYDLIIIGAGPAGLTAGLYTAREGVSTLIIDRGGWGGRQLLPKKSRTTQDSPNPSAVLSWRTGCAARPSALRWRFWALKR
jgi:thioredoxin reductase (NADPH)